MKNKNRGGWREDVGKRITTEKGTESGRELERAVKRREEE